MNVIIFVPNFCSISAILALYLFNNSLATLGDTFKSRTLDLLLIDFSVTNLNTDSQTLATDLTQIVFPIKSFNAGLILCRDISSRPNLDILSS